MIDIRKFTNKTLKYLVIIAFIISGGYLSYAQFSTDAYVVKTVHIFPAEISGDGWTNLETLTFQNLEEYALLQEFNSINSATMVTSQATLNRLEQLERDSETNETDTVSAPVEENTPASGSEETTPDTPANEPTIEDATTTESLDSATTSTTTAGTVEFDVTAEDEAVIPDSNTNTSTEASLETDESSAPEAAVAPAKPAEDSATTTVMRRVSSLFRLAVETVTSFTGSSSNESNDTTVVDDTADEQETLATSSESSAENQPTPDAESATNPDRTATSTIDEATSLGVTTSDEPTASTSEAAEVNATTSTSSADETVSPAEGISDTPETTSPATEPTGTSSTATVAGCVDECRPYVITLDNFTFPLDEGVEVTGAQLRMSFAASKKDTREHMPMFEVRYSVDNGSTWEESGVIVIDDEASNSVNGGYYLFATPQVTDQASLDALQVELTYHDDPRILESLFVESAWLELFTVEPPEELPQTSFAEILANDGYDPEPLSGDVLELPGGEQIEFNFTDENTDETLIIKSNERTYHGVSEAATYFSVTNTSNDADEIQIQAYFPNEVGEVKNLEVFEQNKPRQVTVPEYRPYVYHCEAGWEYAGEFTESTLEDLSRQLYKPEANTLEVEAETSTTSPVFDVPTTSTSTLPTDESSNTTTNTTTVMKQLPGVSELLQLSTVEPAATSSTETNAGAIEGAVSSEANIADSEDDADLVAGYTCRNTNVVRECDELDGDNTACRVNQVKVAEHKVTNYAPGWEGTSITGEAMPTPGLLARVASFIGFGPDRKDVPEEFEARAHTPDTFTIQPGETLYFKMDIAFPPFTTGEYWIEAVGDSEYGLLDPFWSSQWTYRLPITIDNTSTTDTLTEQQVFLELDNTLSDFWTNVNEDGSDIRFIQETIVGNEEDWYGTGWGSRTPITIQASQVDENLTNFPVYVDLSDLGSSFFSSVQSDGADIRITNDDGMTELPYELVSINTGAETGELHFKADAVSSSTDTTFYIYHDNPNVNGYSETDTYGAQNVWGSEFIAVYHMEENASGRGNTALYQDSTDNEYDADDELNSTGKSGQLGQGQQVNAQGDANEYILLPSDIVNSESELTFSYWMNSSEGNSQALVNGGSGNEYLLFVEGSGTSMNLFPGGTVGMADVSNSTWRHVTVSRDTGANQWEVFVDGQSEGTNGTSLGTLSIPADCLVVGLEQDTSCLNSGDTSQHLNAFIDEMRFRNDIPTAGEVSATFRNQDNTTGFYNVGTIDTLTITNFTELDHWVQHFSTTTEEADIWVQVDSLAASASTTIYLYYGNSGALSASDEMAPFTYSTTTELYYVVNDDLSTSINLYSLIDNNVVQVAGGSEIPLDKGEVTTITTYSATTAIRALGPITTLQSSGDGPEPVVPISFATTTHAYPSVRGTEEFDVYAPFASTSVSIFDGNAGTPTVSFNVATGTQVEQSAAAAASSIIEATDPVLVFASNDTAADSVVLYPPTTRDLYGMATRDYFYTPINGSAQVAEFCSASAASTSTGLTRGVQAGNGNCNTTSDDGQGEGVRLTNITEPITAIQQRDSDGTESAVFLPEMELGTSYIVPADMNYIAIVCSPRFGASDVSVYTSAGTEVDTGTCTPASDNAPGTLLFDGGDGDALLYTQGYRVQSTNATPFWIMYEENDQDGETNTWGAPQARKYATDKPYNFGTQEINIDAEYEQYSYAWYQNTDGETPTSTWPIGESGSVSEGEPISGEGAVNDGDVFRLRMSVRANTATGTASSTAFALQYAAAETCSTASGWQEIGKVGSSTAAFSGFNNSSVDDGQTLTSTILNDSTVFGTYEEASLSEFIPNDIAPGEIAEWDWVLTSSNAAVNTDYCFRMVRSSGDELVNYSSFPQLLTAGPPETVDLLKRFDNEHANSLRPTFDFVASDSGGDDLQYQIQIASSTDFISDTVLDQDSETNFQRFENVSVPSDKEPFNSGQVIRYTPPSDLTSSTTYWWRVRSIDPGGSNTYSNWSESFSFTINESLSVSEWYQTTDEQFETNSLVSVQSSGSDSVELDIGSSILGEYGSLEVANNSTTTITYNNSYSDPVVVASIRYPRSVGDGDQRIARIVSKTSSDFDVLALDDGLDAAGSSTIDYMVMESGEYLMDDGANGVRVYATSTLVSSYQGGAGGNPSTDVVTFPTSFSGDPMVVAMVTSNNDPDWIIASVYSGSDDNNPPSANEVKLYLNDSLYSDGHTASEQVDVIAVDIANGSNNGVNFNVTTSGSTNVTDSPTSISFSPAFSAAPNTVLVQSLTNTGADGGYGMIDTDNPVTASDVTVAIDEGTATGRAHGSAEEVGAWAFADSSGDIVRSGDGQMTSTVIDFDDAEVGNAWGEFAFNDSGDVTYRLQYQTGSGFADIPDSALAGNSTGFTTAPVNILSLDTDVYNEIRLVATLTGVSPEIFDWRVTWGQRVNIPELGDPFNNEKIPTTTPTFDFTTTDPQGDDLVYEISWSTDNTFTTSSTTRNSSVSSDFSAGSPYTSGDTVTFTIPPGDALTDGETYWWRVRAIDPAGDNSFSPWSDPDSFTVDTATIVSTWFQTTAEQFQTGTLSGVSASTTADSVTNDSSIGEYGTIVVDNGSSTVVSTQRSYNDPVVVTSVRYTRGGADGTQRVSRVLNKTSNNFTVLADNYDGSVTGTTTVDYLVIEAGDWTIVDGGSGTRIVADTIDVSTVVGNGSIGSGMGGTTVTFDTPFSSAPAVITNVSSNNDSSYVFSSVYENGTDNTLPPSVSGFNAVSNRNFATPATHDPEEVDYIAIAPGSGTNDGSQFESIVTADSITHSPATISFSPAFSSIPQVTLVQQVTQEGGNGGYAMVDTDNPATVNDVTIAIDEDGPSNSRTGHANEIAAVLAFESASGILTRENTDGVITSSPVLFSDGLGPKFARYLFSASTPANSTTTFQVEYRTATGSWALVPDTDIPGNSSGTTTSPVNLSSVDVSTYDVIRLIGTLECDGTSCPTLNDWSVEWSEGVPISGTIREYDRVTDVTSGTVQVAVNGVLGNTGTIQGDGTWSIDNVTAFDGDTVTVWVDGAAEANEAVAVFVYDGVGDMTDIELYEQHLSLSAAENGTTTNADLSAYDNSVSGDEDIFFDVDGNNDLTVCAVGSCADANLYIGPGDIYVPDTTDSGNIETHDFVNDGTFELDGNTMRVSGSWDDNATTDLTGSTVIFTATTGNETVDDTDNLLDFNNVTFGEGSGTASWKTFDPLDVNGDLAVDYGTFDRASSTIAVAGDVSTGANGFWSGVATTTFDGSATAFWSDANAIKQDVGEVVVDGNTKLVFLSSDVQASGVRIGANDTLNAGGANVLNLTGDFTNTGTFLPQTSTVAVVGTTTDSTITVGGSELYNLNASSSGGTVSFTESNVTLLGDLTIATGTVNLATAVTTIDGSFQNTGGNFAHNNAEVRFTSGSSETIELQGTQFLNHFYDVRFTGSGDWTFLDTNATTSNTFTITNGDVTLPSGQLSVARDFTTSGSGAFDNNGGEVLLLIEGNDNVTTSGSAFNDVRIREGSGGSGNWYFEEWQYRIPVTIRATAVDENMTDFPVYVDLSDLPSALFSNLVSDGGDIRMTESDGSTEVAREVVNASTTAETGELYFQASSLSSTTDTVFYLYYGNATATDYAVTDTYGAENVWSNGYVLVAHMDDETTSTIVNSANGTLDGSKLSANNPSETDSGQIYEAQDFVGTEHIAFGNVGGGASNITISAWINPSNLTGSGDTDTYGYSIFSAHSGGNYTWLTVGGTGNGGATDEVRFCAFSSSATCNVASGSNVGTSQWHYVSATAVDGGSANVRVDGTNVLSFTSDGGGSWNSGSTIGDLRPNRDIEFEGIIDAVHISDVVRSTAWQDATYLNQATTSDFYAVGTPQQDSVRTFADTNATIEGNFVIESGETVLPTGVLSIGGSLDNDDEFAANGGTVRLNSTSSAETIAPGSSSFYNLTFDSLGGDWTVIENATATNAINFTAADTLTIDTGIVLESDGTFTNDLANASTTWTGATLRLSSGNDMTLNSKTNEGDDYNILTVTGDGIARMWNSTAATYDTQDTSSIYSQDHAGVDGDLYIFGDYVRESGTEYWSYATDFDGADLTAGSNERLANIRVDNGASVTASSSTATLEIVGTSTASTTIDAQSGSFTLLAQTATVTAEYFEMTGTDADGFQLLSSSTVAQLANAEFTIPAASAAITVDATTVDHNPEAQYFNTDFVTGAGTPVNVALSGSPSSFWWFRDGAGDRYGEAFDDAGDGNPGSIQWDDSNFQIDISGTVYADDGVTTMGVGTCDGLTNNVRIVVDDNAYTDAVPCDGSGNYSFNNVSYNGDANIVVYLDTNGGERGSVVSRTPTGDITDMDIYANRVIVRHENTAVLSIADMTEYDNDDDSDILFTASTSTSPDTLDLLPGTGLYVWDNKEFSPNGTVTLQGGGNFLQDGSLDIGPGATYTSDGTNAITIGGSLYVETGGVFAGASSTVSFTATNTAQQIGAAGSSTVTFYNVEFTGAGGGWAVQTPIVVATDVLVSDGTVSGDSDITVETGEFTGEGSVDMTGGDVTINRANTLGGSGEWTFYDLTLGNGVNSEVTVRAANATTTVRNSLTIATGHFLDAYGSVWDLQGSGATLVENGTFIQGTSTVRFSGATPNITQTPYYNLVIDTQSGPSTVATAPITGLQVLGNLTVGALSTATLDLDTNDPLLSVSGDVYIGASGTIDASGSNTLNAFGDWDNDGTFSANGGTVDFKQTSGTALIAAGDSDFANVDVTGAATFTFTESATATASFDLDSAGFTLDPGQTLAVGGPFTNNNLDVQTTWTGSTLRLYGGGAYTINSKTIGNTYNTISIAGNTHPRLWNSTITSVITESGSSLYSQDHDDVAGDLYIYGEFVSSTFNDHWSYATDFDGAALGVNRIANVLVEPGGSVLYEGGSLTVTGSTSASTSIAAQSVGTFDLTLGGTTTVDLGYYEVRDTTTDGLVFTGSPSVTDISNGDFEVAIAGGSAITVGGGVIDDNPALEFNLNRFATTTSINAFNVTATGTSVSAWRFVNVLGNLGGEDKDVDPGGDPGYITWEDSAAIINISGTVYSDEGVTVSSACDDVTNNIRLSINGTTFASTTCDSTTGDYTFTGISYGLGNTLTVYINDELEDAVAVTQDPVSSLVNFDLYENRVIIKHESAAPMTIADMGTWDSDDDPDILFDVETTGIDTLTLPADTKLIVWNNKEFEPQGDVTVAGGGAGASYDGTLELRAGATFTGANGNEYTIGGSLLAGAGATFDSGQSTTTFTTTGAGRTIDTNDGGFYNVDLSGSGSWTVSDSIFIVDNDLDKTAGALTLPNGTSTIGGSFTNSGGTFNANSGTLVFTATDGGNDVTLGGSDANAIRFEGVGNWTMSDTSATATASFVVATGTVTLPSGVLEVGDDFIVSDTIAHNNGTLRLTGTGGGNLLTLSGSDLNDVLVVAGAGDYTQTDAGAAFLGDLIVQSGTYTAGTSTLSVGGSFDATGGTFVNNSGNVLFNSDDTGEIVDPGASEFYNVTFAGAGGGWTIADSATSTNNFTVSTGASFTQSSGSTLYVGGAFTNTLGGNATDWNGSTLVLDSATEYEINLKSTPTEQYENLILGNNTDISAWNTAATSTSVPANSSLYSQDHAGNDGELYIYGDYHIGTTTEYWSNATDFDGVALGAPRAVNVAVEGGSTITVQGGVLNLIGAASASTTVSNQGSGTYTFVVNDGTFNADYYSFRDLDADGLQFISTPNITSLSRGDFEQANNGTTLITLASTTLDANASLLITDTRFDTGGFLTGTNVSLDATSTNSWTFTGAIGDLWGEAFDQDGSDQCSSLRWDDSDCLLTEQTNYRWRNDDGGEGAAPGTWYDSNWDARQRVRIINNDPVAYSDAAVKLSVTYDADMQSDFDDLRFTDSTGTVLIDHWRERFTSASDADVWVQVPELATSSVTEIYMYYGNVGAASVSDIDNVFTAADDFEDNNITEYSGDTSLFATGGTYAFGGGYGLDASPNTSAKATDGIARTDVTVSQGETIRFMQNVNLPAGSADEVCTMFAVQAPVTANQNYAVCLSPLRDRVTINEDVENIDTTGAQLATSSISLSDGWYEVEVDWQSDGTMDVSVFDDSGTLQATTSATDSTYTSGGIGFTFWGQNGGWDSYVSWPRTNTKPAVRFGAEQADGGASWAAAQDTPTGGFLLGDTVRLRAGIENTGLAITDQNFRLEYAPKLAAPTCAAVSGGSFTQVPTNASCGSSEICMTTSASTTNGDPTTDHLISDAGTFTPGKIVADTSNQTGNLDVDQNEYTELEYAINLTVNAENDAYCFRVTDAGALLDSYALFPELTLAFDPTLDTVTLNDGLDISLTPGTTTTVIASTTVTDLNGVGDLSTTTATTTFYKTSVGAACTPDNNNCYIATGNACSFTDCTANSCTFSCEAEFQFHADPTHDDGAEEWFAFMEVSDKAGGVDFATSIGVDVFTLRALEVLNSIGYGTVDVTEDTGSFNPNVILNNLGNEPIDVQVSGSDMTDGGASVIPASQQRFATSTFIYSSCVNCNPLTVTGTTVELDLSKPTTDAPPVSDEIYWGIAVPFGTASNPHSGINTFTAVAD